MSALSPLSRAKQTSAERAGMSLIGPKAEAEHAISP
jgi:hypothetical protein